MGIIDFIKDIIRPGNGVDYPKAGDMVTVHYHGYLYDPTRSWNRGRRSIKRGIPFTFQIGMGTVIKGWEVGILGMSLGEKALLTFGPHYGYGARGAPPFIPGNSTLVLSCDLCNSKLSAIHSIRKRVAWNLAQHIVGSHIQGSGFGEGKVSHHDMTFVFETQLESMSRTLSATAHQVTGKCTLLVTVVLSCRIKDGKEDGSRKCICTIDYVDCIYVYLVFAVAISFYKILKLNMLSLIPSWN
ncbi:hypothetical protein BDV30DRAFT_222292 [Aspergillus minisclerotigenes]|uniref:peptidylprolyl isomerase n=1 Tax=Aspergillus minisclerotigenes TaxID=656917 RepID=A0A5N6JL79_9EURO|nr:hypothetical protein BDV30DRAFT_222292 [Aspergillus minisclerotigenes]